MKKLMIIFVAALTLSSAVRAKVTIKPLKAAEGKVLIIYEVKCNEQGATGFVFPPRGGLTSLDRKPLLVSVIEKGSGKKLKAVVKSYIENGKTIPGKYEFHTNLERPLQKDEKRVLEFKIIVYNKPNCYIDKTGRWVCKYSTRQNATFLVPKGHTPVFSSHPVRIFEDQGTICLQTNTKPIEPKERAFVFKTIP